MIRHHAAPDTAVQFILSRETIEAGDTAPALAALRALSATAADARRYGGTLELMFSGYSDDPRAIYQVPEIRRYVRTLHQSWPYWFHFCSKTTAALLNVMLCLMPFESWDGDGNGVVRIKLVEGALQRLMFELFAGVNTLYEALQIGEDENAALTDQVTEYVTAFLSGD